jgi:hypothetical protein
MAAHAPLAVVVAQRVDADHHALHAEGIGKFGDQRRAFQRRRVDRDLVGAGMQHRARFVDAANASSDAERDVEQPRQLFDPTAVNAAPLRARGDVVEHQLVGAGIAVAPREFGDVAHVDVVAETHTLDHAAIAHV